MLIYPKKFKNKRYGNRIQTPHRPYKGPRPIGQSCITIPTDQSVDVLTTKGESILDSPFVMIFYTPISLGCSPTFSLSRD